MNHEWILEKLEKALRQDWMAPPNRGALAYLGRVLRRRSKLVIDMNARRGVVMVTSDCNLDCFGCVARGPHWRSESTNYHSIIRFFRILRELYPGCNVHFTGGEPTLYENIELAAVTAKFYGFAVDMLTNGARLIDLTPFDNVLVDDHGVNHEDVLRFVEHCKSYPHLNWDVKNSRWHRDTAAAIRGNLTKGVRCAGWMFALMLRGDVFYPCCNLPVADFWHGGTAVEDAFREAGWHVDNPEAADVVRRWRETVPDIAYRVCALGCWQNCAHEVGWRLIQGSKVKETLF